MRTLLREASEAGKRVYLSLSRLTLLRASIVYCAFWTSDSCEAFGSIVAFGVATGALLALEDRPMIEFRMEAMLSPLFLASFSSKVKARGKLERYVFATCPCCCCSYDSGCVAFSLSRQTSQCNQQLYSAFQPRNFRYATTSTYQSALRRRPRCST